MAGAPELTRILVDLQQLQRELLEESYVRRADGLHRVGDAMRRLGEIGSPAGVIARSAEELGRSAGFDRVLVSRLDSERLQPLSLWSSAGPEDADATLSALAERVIDVGYPLIEADVARRGEGAVVSLAASGRRAQPELRDALKWQSYVTAAIALEGNTVGLLHADRAEDRRDLDGIDLELATRFADGLALTFERAVLRDKLQRQRHQLESAARWISGQTLRLTAEDARTSAADASRSEAPLDVLLTRRELDVLRLIARGQSNKAIATSLMLGEGTVKYHVKNILRKLQVRSRTEAVSRFTRLHAVADGS